GSVARALLLPGSRVGFLLSKIDQATDRLFRLATRRMESHASRSRIRSIHAPVILAAQLWSWLALYLVGYALLLWPITHRLGSALRESGSSLLTLGFAVTRSGPGLGIDLLAAATGLIVVALQLAYLPTLYNASIAPEKTPIQARLFLRMGFGCLQQLARTVGIPYDPDPRPDAGIRLSEEEFRQGVARMQAYGFPVKRSLDEAWVHFQGWRVNY